jgi:nucleotide-binding universal stress UspA family protein
MRTLLVPIDLSLNSQAALKFALAIAAKHKVEISALHAYQVDAHNHFLSLDSIRQLEQKATGEADKKVRAFLQSVQSESKVNHTIDPVLRLGFATEEIIAVCEQVQVDLVVMGTRGITDATSKYFGTNTRTVMENISSPVLAVNSEAVFQGFTKILYVTNLESTSVLALGRLLELATSFGASIHVLHINHNGTEHVSKYEQKIPGFFTRAVKYDQLTLTVAKSDDVLDEVYRCMVDQKPDVLAVNADERAIYSKVIAASDDHEAVLKITTPILAIS